MTKSLHDGVETFDGEEVEYYTGKFSGTFDLDNVTGAALALDDLVSFVVTARVCNPALRRDNKTHVLKRQNTFSVESVSALDPSKAQWLYDQLGKIVVGVNHLVVTSGGTDIPEGLPFDDESNVTQLVIADDDDELPIGSDTFEGASSYAGSAY